MMPYPFKNQFKNTKSQHLDIPDFIIGRQNNLSVCESNGMQIFELIFF